MRLTTIALAILLILVPLSSAASNEDVLNYYIEEPLDDVQPRIFVYFGENSVTIAEGDYSLTYADTSLNDQPLPDLNNDVSEGDWSTTHEFSVPDNIYLFGNQDGVDYVFTANASDDDNNYIYVNVYFTIQTDDPPIYIEKPFNHNYPSETDYAMANQSTFNFSIYLPEIPAHNCRWGFLTDAINAYDTDEEVYNYLGAQGDFPNKSVSNDIFYEENIDISFRQEGKLYNVIVACYQQDELYNKQVLFLSYDSTPPNFIQTRTNFTPDDLNNANLVRSNLNVGTDDKTFCTFNNTAYPLAPEQTYLYNAENYFSENTVSGINSYEENHTKTLNFYEMQQNPPSPDELEPPYNYTFNVTCENIAGQSSWQTLDLQMEFDNTLEIIRNEPNTYVPEGQTDFDFTTNLPATCTLTLDGTEQTITTGMQTHTGTINLEQGTHDYTLTCTGTTVGGTTYEGTVTADSTPPLKPNITSYTEILCGDDDLQVTIETEEDDLDYYHYVLTIQGESEPFLEGEKNANDETTIELELILSEETTYEFEVYAVDEAGNGERSPEITSVEIQLLAEENILCDHTKPITRGILEPDSSGAGYNFNITCEDYESGCTDSIYLYTPENDTCSDNITEYSPTSYSTNQEFYVSEQQHFCWYVEDVAGNYRLGEAAIGILSDIQIEQPRFGIAATETFNLEATTDADATCKIGFFIPDHPANLGDWYGQLQTTFDTTGAQTHTINDFNFATLGSTTCQGKEACEKDVTIICKEPTNNYYEETFTLGYDTTPPELTIAIIPNPVIKPGNLRASMNIQSDDKVWCRFDDGTPLQEGTKLQSELYETTVDIDLGLFSPPEAPLTSYTEDYNITCINLADLATTQIETLTIEPKNEVAVTIHTSKKQETSSVLIEATTDHEATCTYTLNPNHPGTPLQTSNNNNHTLTTRFTEDEHEIIIYCQTLDQLYEGIASKEIVVDTTPPEMLAILASNNTCSLEKLTATFMSNASIIGLDHYNYSIANQQGNFLVEWTTTSNNKATQNLALTSGESYSWNVIAIDEFGRASQSMTKTVKATETDDTTCDFTNPQATMTSSTTYQGVNLLTNCTDTGTGCTDYYHFTFSETNSCDEAAESHSFTEGAIIISNTGTACATVYDKAGNQGETSKKVQFAAHCINRVQDPEEEGVDCGGPCPISCEVCTNEEKDPGEEGVDCGGICPRSCTQMCGNGIVEPGEECDTRTTTTCDLFNLGTGTVTCTDTCKLNTEDCEGTTGMCGDDTIGPGETCDGLNWGNIRSCTDISSTFISGTPTCANCHFNTFDCVPNPNAKKTCDYDTDCNFGQECINNQCEKKGSTNNDTNNSCTTNADCSAGRRCSYGECILDVPEPTTEKHTAGIILLILGLLSLLGGTGYLVYTTFIAPPTITNQPQQTQRSPQPKLDPEELERKRAAELEARKRKLALQEKAKERAQKEKEKERNKLLASFKKDDLAEPTSDDEKTVTTPTKKEATNIKPKKTKKASTIATKEGDVFEKLEELENKEQTLKSTDEVFADLAKFTGATKSKIKTTINKNNTTAEELVELFKNTEKKDVTPKNVTPALKHLITTGKIEHETAHKTIHELHAQEKLTDNQKQKILEELETI